MRHPLISILITRAARINLPGKAKGSRRVSSSPRATSLSLARSRLVSVSPQPDGLAARVPARIHPPVTRMFVRSQRLGCGHQVLLRMQKQKGVTEYRNQPVWHPLTASRRPCHRRTRVNAGQRTGAVRIIIDLFRQYRSQICAVSCLVMPRPFNLRP